MVDQKHGLLNRTHISTFIGGGVRPKVLTRGKRASTRVIGKVLECQGHLSTVVTRGCIRGIVRPQFTGDLNNERGFQHWGLHILHGDVLNVYGCVSTCIGKRPATFDEIGLWAQLTSHNQLQTLGNCDVA